MSLLAPVFLAASALALDPFARIGITVVEAEGRVLDADEDINASSIALKTEAGAQIEGEKARWTLKLDADYVDFDNPGFEDRWRYRARLEHRRELDEDWELRLRADAGWNIPSVEYFDIEQYELRARIAYSPVRAHRLRGAFRWRERLYEDGTRSRGSGPRIEGEYRYRLRAYNYLEAAGRFEQISASDPRRDYRRWAGAVTYTHPVARDLRIRPKLAYRATDFTGRDLAGGGYRRDRQWTPEIEALWWPGRWRHSLELQYRWRNSSDPDRTFEGPRVEIQSAYVF